MSCLGQSYNPNPPREWVRYSNRQLNNSSDNFAEGVRLQMLRKGNILQYKKNAAHLTKKQSYSRLIQRQYTSWASQSSTSSNPNNGLLKRVNSTFIVAPQSSNIIDNSSITSIQYTNCISASNPGNNNALPSQPIPPSGQPPQPPPPIPPQQTSNGTSIILQNITPNGVILYLIENGGTLLCNQIVAPCSGQLLQEFRSGDCYPTTCSNVPGTPQLLCWSGKEQTYFPKVKRTYGTSGNKWPENAKFIHAAV